MLSAKLQTGDLTFQVYLISAKRQQPDTRVQNNQSLRIRCHRSRGPAGQRSRKKEAEHNSDPHRATPGHATVWRGGGARDAEREA